MPVLLIIKKYLGADMVKFVKLLIFNLLIINLGIVYSIGRQDIVGYTYYDWQTSGPPYTNLVCDTLNGVHVSWMSSSTTTHTDRNQGYNFYDFTTGTWHWLGTGINVFTQRCGFGGMDVNLVTGCAVLSTNQGTGTSIAPVFAIDQTPGAGNWQYIIGPAGYQSAPVAITNNQAIHCALIDAATMDSLYYFRIQPGQAPINIGSPVQPGYPNHNINGSKISDKIVVTWDAIDTSPRCKYYRQSLDGGLTWQNSVSIMPPAFTPGSETIPASWLGSFGYYERDDNLHIVTAVYPVIGQNGFVWPAEIWHYSPVNTPNWSRVQRAQAENVNAPVGYNAIACCRPSLAQDRVTGTLYCVWEQFDSLNYEPLTQIARADIWLSESYDNGLTWIDNRRITTLNTTSKRFPIAAGTVWKDTLLVRYLIDSIAGFEVQTQGRATRNPIVCHFIPLPYAGIEQDIGNRKLEIGNLSVAPNPFSSQTTIRYSLPINTSATIEIRDVTGRFVKSFSNNQQQTTTSCFTWLGKDELGNYVKSGVYFFTLRTSDNVLTAKVIKTE